MTRTILCTNLSVKVFVILFSFITFSTEAQKLTRKKIPKRDFILNPEIVKKIGGTKYTDYIKYLIAKRKEAVEKGIKDFPVFIGNDVISSTQLIGIKSKEDLIAFYKKYKSSRSTNFKGDKKNTPSSDVGTGICDNSDLLLHTSPDNYGHYSSKVAVDYYNQNALIVGSANVLNIFEEYDPLPGIHFTTDGGSSWSGRLNLGAYTSTVLPAYDDLAYEFALSYLDTYGENFELMFLKTADVGAHWYKQTTIFDDWYEDDYFIQLPYANDQLLYNNYPSSPFYGELYSSWTTMLWNPYPNQILYLNSLFYSADDGDTFDGPFALTDHFNLGTSMTYRDNGDMYVCWLDLGEYGTWNNLQIGFTTVYANGTIDAPTTIQSVNVPSNYLGDRSFKIAIDNSQGSHRGRIYILYNNYESVFGNNIFRPKVIYSDNGGYTWSSPVNVVAALYNAEAHSLHIDESSGICYIGLRENVAGDVYTKIAFSDNGGASFELSTISDLPPSSLYIDYNGCDVVCQNNQAWTTWTAFHYDENQPYNSLAKLFYDKIKVQYLNVTAPSGCAPGTASVMGLQPGSTVTWSSYPTGMINITTSGNGQTANYSVMSAGNVTIYAYINGPCPYVLDKPITVQLPNITLTGTYTSPPYVNQPLLSPYIHPIGYKTVAINVQSPTDPNATFQWQITNAVGGTPTFTTNGNGSYILIARNGATGFTVGIHIFTSCGDAWKYYYFGEGAFQLTYNTESKTLNVVTENPQRGQFPDNQNKRSIMPDNDIRYVRIYDNSSRLVVEKKYPANTKQSKIDLSGLISGVYFVESGNLQHRSTKTIVVL
ncbi:MAG: exo-alpha-sialidase [Bacteroidia bacterium]|nr:exo-alpha-sialidase [Bacteroidia bacterium]